MIATFIDLTGQTFVRDIKKLDKIIKYCAKDDSARMLQALFEKTPIPNPERLQTYTLMRVEKNIPIYKEVIDGYIDPAQLRRQEFFAERANTPIKEEPVKRVEVKAPVQVVDSGFEAMYKKLTGGT